MKEFNVKGGKGKEREIKHKNNVYMNWEGLLDMRGSANE